MQICCENCVVFNIVVIKFSACFMVLNGPIQTPFRPACNFISLPEPQAQKPQL